MNRHYDSNSEISILIYIEIYIDFHSILFFFCDTNISLKNTKRYIMLIHLYYTFVTRTIYLFHNQYLDIENINS